MLEIWPFYTFVPKTTTIWGTVPEILSETNIVILSHFCPFIPLTTRKIKILKKWKMYLEMSSFYRCMIKITAIWCMLSKIWSATDKIFVILSHFLPNYLTHNLKNQIFKKWKKATVFWDMERQTGRVFFSFWTIFFPFTNRTAPPPATLQHPKKAKFWKNEKHLEISSFYTSVTKSWSYAILFLRYGVWRM